VTLTEVQIATRAPYRVIVGSGALARAEQVVASRAGAVLTDTTVAPLHLHRLGATAEWPVLAIDPGETSKSFQVLERVLDFLAGAGLDRSSVLVTLGGGVVSDLGGLAASLYMRGIDVVHGPTTLLAQVDAAVGGKTAVNLAAGKNLAGTFHQPTHVLADTATLATLTEEDFESGLGEVVKSALIGDTALFELLERETSRVADRDPELLAEVVTRCVRVKGALVARDEHEAGERKQLNLGHTFAHATGLGLALEASARTDRLADAELAPRTRALLEGLGLCPTLAALRERHGVALPADALLAGMRHDKKGPAGEPAFVLLTALGEVATDARLEPTLLADILG